jgi:hypothetical protein
MVASLATPSASTNGVSEQPPNDTKRNDSNQQNFFHCCPLDHFRGVTKILVKRHRKS